MKNMKRKMAIAGLTALVISTSGCKTSRIADIHLIAANGDTTATYSNAYDIDPFSGRLFFKDSNGKPHYVSVPYIIDYK